MSKNMIEVSLSVYDNVYLHGDTVSSDWSVFAIALVCDLASMIEPEGTYTARVFDLGEYGHGCALGAQFS